MAKTWTEFPYDQDPFTYTATTLKKNWSALHRGDAEPYPSSKALVAAWISFHRGDFDEALSQGLAAGTSGMTVANLSQAIYANYLERSDPVRLKLFQDVAARAEKQQAADPENANAYYLHAYALGRYSQGISIAKALAQGLGSKVKASLDRAVSLQPNHANAHIALGTYHAEIIDKVGSLIGGLTYGAKKEIGLKHFQRALEINPESAISLVEYANGMVMLEGKRRLKEAEALYEKAAAATPRDAMEQLDIAMAQAEMD